MKRDTIIIGDDPFSAEYWQAERIASLVNAFRDMLALVPSVDRYKKWWREACGGTDAEAGNMAAAYLKLAATIRHDGYKPDEWKSSPRNFDESKGQGPITVKIGIDGAIATWDGAHRSAILKCLGLPVVAEVFTRAPEWERLKEYHKTLYTPYPHPDFAGHPVTRRGTERFEAVLRKMGGAPGRVVVLGACTGFGAAHFQQRHRVLAVEPTKERRTLLHYWFDRLAATDAPHLTTSSSYAHELDYGGGTVVALSVLQHAATSITRMSEIAGRMTTSPQLFIELPGDHEKQWHHNFRDETHGCLQASVLASLTQAGGYDAPIVVFTDHTYANRQTLLLERS